MLRPRYIVVTGVFIALTVICVGNVGISCRKSKKLQALLREATHIRITACFVNDRANGIQMVTLTNREDIEKLANRLHLRMWTSPLEYPGVNSYVLEIHARKTIDIVNVNISSGVLRVTRGNWMQALTPDSASYLLDVAESQGVSSDEVFTRLARESANIN